MSYNLSAMTYRISAIFNIPLFLLTFVLLYHDTLRRIFRSWIAPEGSHGPLIFAVSIYLAWKKRKYLSGLLKRPALLLGVWLCGLGGFLLVVGKFSGTMALQKISLVPMLLGTIGLFFGYAQLRALLIPVCYLVFLTDFVEVLFGGMVVHLQTASAWIGAKLLGLLGFPALLSVTFIELPHITLEVVRACSGVSHIVSLIALSIPLAYQSHKIGWKRVIIVLIAPLIGILANGLRIALIGFYTHFFPESPIHGPEDSLHVSFIFFIGMLVLIGVSYVLGRIGPIAEASNAQISGVSQRTAKQEVSKASNKTESDYTSKWFSGQFLGISIIVAALGIIHFYAPLPIRLQIPLKSFPVRIGDFSGKDLSRIDNRLRPYPADEELMRVYENGDGKRAELYIGYFETQSWERKILGYHHEWMHQGVKRLLIGHDGGRIYINRTKLINPDSSSNIYFWYDIDGDIITSRYLGKLRIFLSSLLSRKTNAAVVVVNSRSSDADLAPLLEKLVPLVKAYLLTA